MYLSITKDSRESSHTGTVARSLPSRSPVEERYIIPPKTLLYLNVRNHSPLVILNFRQRTIMIRGVVSLCPT